MELPFSDDDLALIAEGNKVVHSSQKKWAKIGDGFTLEGKTYRVKAIEKMSVSRAIELWHHAEGYQNILDFQEAYRKREKKRKWTGTEDVFVHFFFCVSRGG